MKRDGAAEGASWIDVSAIGLSGLCLVHCLAEGLFIAALSALSVVVAEAHTLHLIFLGLAIPAAAFAFWRGWTRHRRLGIAQIGAIGLLFMVIAVLQPFGHDAEVALTVVGVAVLGFAHLRNIGALRSLNASAA
jgi:hypothetical protein